MNGFIDNKGNLVVTTEYLMRDKFFALQRHSVEYCKCSFCRPISLDYKTLPPVGRFEIEVPPKDNPWKWTHITWRWGKWQYHLTVDVQLFPSVPPFLHKEKWDGV